MLQGLFRDYTSSKIFSINKTKTYFTNYMSFFLRVSHSDVLIFTLKSSIISLLPFLMSYTWHCESIYIYIQSSNLITNVKAYLDLFALQISSSIKTTLIKPSSSSTTTCLGVDHFLCRFHFLLPLIFSPPFHHQFNLEMISSEFTSQLYYCKDASLE